MRRYWVLALAVIGLLGMLAPPAQAQAPAPKVTIGGTLDTVTSSHWNLSQTDLDFTRSTDTIWASRQRFTPVILAEVDKARAVLAFELDLTWGKTGAGATQTALAEGPQLAFSTGTAMGASVDVVHPLEVKHLYVEFPMPLMPWPSTIRLGGQPGANTVGYKPIVFFDDFPGVYLVTTFTPAVKGHLVVAQHDENGFDCGRITQGARDTGCSTTVGGATGNRFARGDDLVLAANLEVTPWKGLDLRPLFIHWTAKGQPDNSQNTPQGSVGGLSRSAAFGSDQARLEWYYWGLDARWRQGPWSLDPTFIYLHGRNKMAVGAFGIPGTPGRTNAGRSTVQDVSSWIADVRGAWRSGPLLLEGLVIYTPGNEASDDLTNDARNLADQNYFNPINTGGGFGAGWSNFQNTNGIDYIRAPYLGATGLSGGTSISYDRYGRISAALRPTYALTKALSLNGLAAGHWTAEEVDNDGTIGATGIATANGGTTVLKSEADGDSNYWGTEIAGGLTWAFAPGLTFDAGAAHLFAGSALEQCKGALVGGRCGTGKRDARDATSVAARVRFAF